ncbi:MAG: radical SAM protein [Planctomycetota bacterium]
MSPMRSPRQHTSGIIGQVGYYIHFGFRTFIMRRPIPIVGGLSITDVCNLDCRHCWRKNTGQGPASFPAVQDAIAMLYGRGVRFLYIQGGEPFTWGDGGRTLIDVVDLAKRSGFFHVAVCTNGTYPLNAVPDTYWVSLDGIDATHDRIRGEDAFRRVQANVRASDHPNICGNITINRENAPELERILRFAAGEPHLRGVLINFHIPYPGVEHLRLDPAMRREVADWAITLKRQGLPVINSISGLRSLGRNTWPRPLKLSLVSDCISLYTCCRAHGQDHICRECGYAVWAELSRIFRPNILESCRLLFQLYRFRTRA